MSLDWKLTEIKDYKTLCWQDNPDGPGQRLNPVTQAIIWRTMTVGFSRITSGNAEEFCRRSYMFDELFDARPISSLEDGVLTRQHLSLADIEMHIGLRTNVADEPEAKWFKRMFDSKRLDLRNSATYFMREQKGVVTIG